MNTTRLLLVFAALQVLSLGLIGAAQDPIVTPDDFLVEKKARTVLDSGRLLLLLSDPKEALGLVLIKIEPLNVISGSGNFAFLNPIDPSQVLKTVPYFFGPTRLHDEMGGFSPYLSTNQLSSLAFCKLSAPKLQDGKIVNYPATYVVADDWVADWVKALTASKVASFFVPPKEPPANLKFPTSLELLIYGNALYNNDPKKFQADYRDLMNHGDIYTRAYFTNLLLQIGENALENATNEVESNKVAATHNSPLLPTADADAKAAAQLSNDIWSQIEGYIQDPNASAGIVIAIGLGMKTNISQINNWGFYAKDQPGETKLNRALGLIQQRIKLGAPEWAEAANILHALHYTGP